MSWPQPTQQDKQEQTTEPSPCLSLTYDTWGRLTCYSDSLGKTASYGYYSDGLRSQKTVDNTTIKYYYNGSDVINETKNGANFATNVMGVDGPISRQYSGYEHYYYKNIHGDVIFAFTSNHWRSSEYSYSAYGETETSYDYFSANPNPIRYSGEYYDTESGMTYLRARYYDPYQRRFISEDPAKDGVNWYAYCGNNPVMFVDPSGAVAYEHFSSPDEAAKDWAWNYYASSDYVAFECASIIYMDFDENGDVYYSYTYGVWGEPHSVKPQEAMKYVPKDAMAFSVIHSHPNSPDFSPADISYATSRNWSIYVVTKASEGVDIKKWSDTRDGYKETTIVLNQAIAPLTNERRIELEKKFKRDWQKHIKDGCKQGFGCEYKKWPRN